MARTRLIAATSLHPQSPVAEAIADLWWLMLVLGVIVFLVFAGLLVAGLRRTAPEPSEDRAPHRRLVARWIVAGGVAMPAVVLVVVFAATLQAMRAVPASAPADALEIELTGHRFWYEVRYPAEGIVTANELHVPVGRQVAVRVTSKDVIHSLWVPALGTRVDMLPERTSTVVLQADRPGEHHSRCGEFCGIQHTNMELIVVAEGPDDFAAWVSSQQRFTEPTGALAREGRAVFVGARCVDCHALRGQQTAGARGPDLTHLPGRRTLGAGLSPNTRENIADWITDPQAIKPGAEMPTTPLTPAQLDALLAYLEAGG
ncbi:MAG TPA: cytochrome c oxidase subunit II [Nitriliruptorales bacterium]|nr:cytochrome c oxidase subunit II [Nitriliruptorales bacterium]